jgi:hydrogenase expression/formation protein HypE
MSDGEDFGPVCPLPAPGGELVQLAHGGGGRAMARLIERLFLPSFDNPALHARHDGAALDLAGRTAFTTDSYVVRPLFFPGGDIGGLAINGTINDLAMCGARPLYLSVGLIIEDGLEMAILERVTASMREAAAAVGALIVTGDTKVVERGNADRLYVNTAGIGRIEAAQPIGPARVRPGDAVLLSGDLGRHGIAVMAAREGLGFESAIESDCAPLVEPVLALIEAGVEVRCLRDLTRGGLASALVEIAESAGLGIELEEPAIACRDDVRSACELLGFDPIYVANEGRFVAFVAPDEADRALAILRRHEVSRAAALIGRVGAGPPGRVSMRGAIGGTRVVDMLSGEQLPRIC